MTFATGLGLEVLLETHNLAELEVAHRIGAKIIGVNNRNLVTFETDINTSLELSTYFKKKVQFIFQSQRFLLKKMLSSLLRFQWYFSWYDFNDR